MLLSCCVPSQIIPKSRIVHLADKQILKRHKLSYPKIIVSKNPPPPPPPHHHGWGGGGRGFRYLAHGLYSTCSKLCDMISARCRQFCSCHTLQIESRNKTEVCKTSCGLALCAVSLSISLPDLDLPHEYSIVDSCRLDAWTYYQEDCPSRLSTELVTLPDGTTKQKTLNILATDYKWVSAGHCT